MSAQQDGGVIDLRAGNRFRHVIYLREGNRFGHGIIRDHLSVVDHPELLPQFCETEVAPGQERRCECGKYLVRRIKEQQP